MAWHHSTNVLKCVRNLRWALRFISLLSSVPYHQCLCKATKLVLSVFVEKMTGNKELHAFDFNDKNQNLSVYGDLYAHVY